MKQTQRTTWFLTLTALFVLLLPMRANAQQIITDKNLTDEHIQLAVNAIIDELYHLKDSEKFWEPVSKTVGTSHHEGGHTALVVLSLLTAGETFQDDKLKDAISYLEKVGMDGTYAVAVRALVWAMLPPKFDKQLRADTKWLLQAFSERAGGWTYQSKPNSVRRDNSITQYGALALWEAAARGINIDKKYWQLIEDHFLEMQVLDGGWNYTGSGKSTGSMTAAGLATLFITQDLLHHAEFVSINPKRNTPSSEAISNALNWMDENFAPDDNPNRFTYYFYYLYAVERAGIASGYRNFGGHDWFREAAAEILLKLCNWDPTTRTMTINHTASEDKATRSTDKLAFSLLFLSRGRVPLAINKLRVDDYSWNNRPRDVANLTRWISAKSESSLNWQIVDLNANPQQWLDAPMLYLASHQRLPWLKDLSEEAEPVKKLKTYLDLGGLVFAVNEGPGSGFGKSIEEVGSVMYPQYDWRTLPDTHWAYTMLFTVQPKRPTLRALSNGVRDLIILSPTTDFSAVLQTHNTKKESIYRTAANIYFYASEFNRPRPRLAKHYVRTPEQEAENSDLISAPLPKVHIVRAMHDGNWNVEPQALEVFAATMTEQSEFDITIAACSLADIYELDPKPTLVIVNSIDELAFTSSQRDSIKNYVENGGVILFETPGGQGKFTLSAEKACSELFGSSIRSLLRHRIITGQDMQGAAKLRRLEYRPFSFESFGGRETMPRLRGMRVGDDVLVLFSREDISHALLNQPCWGIAGYKSDSAQELLANVLRYAIALKE
ncbi:MAG: DUF4159 domain-containing protein [Planctomycetes bacterium]|nr:DUF4159 domain-containing protein [Planctomycetota bacterium]